MNRADIERAATRQPLPGDSVTQIARIGMMAAIHRYGAHALTTDDLARAAVAALRASGHLPE